jgi:hypothetical protein
MVVLLLEELVFLFDGAPEKKKSSVLSILLFDPGLSFVP